MNEKWFVRFERYSLAIACLALASIFVGSYAYTPVQAGGWLASFARLTPGLALLAFTAVLFLHQRIVSLKARVAKLEAETGKKSPAADPPSAAETPQRDDHLRKLHISRLE